MDVPGCNHGIDIRNVSGQNFELAGHYIIVQTEQKLNGKETVHINVLLYKRRPQEYHVGIGLYLEWGRPGTCP